MFDNDIFTTETKVNVEVKSKKSLLISNQTRHKALTSSTNSRFNITWVVIKMFI